MTRKTQVADASGRTILLVDDSLDYVEATRLLLEREGHAVLSAINGPEALSQLRHNQVDLLLLDFYMPGMTGEEVVKELRQFNPLVQVILQTGYASEQPPRDMLRRLDIQGYYDKSEGPQKLLLWVDVGLKSAYTVQLLQHSRQGLKYILDVTPELHKIQPLEDLLQGILFQLTGLLSVSNSFLAILPYEAGMQILAAEENGFVAMVDDETELVIRVATGRFKPEKKVIDCLDAEALALVRQALHQSRVQTTARLTAVPLRIGETTIGVVYLDRAIVVEKEIELLQVFANQAAVAIQNVQLYEMAAFDPLTNVYVRRFFMQMLLRELRTAFRSDQLLALMMVDLDGLKRINDTAGHVVGDQALMLTGKVLRKATRASDIVGRYGGDEFAMALPFTGLEGAERVGQRVLEFLHDQTVSGPTGALALRASLGLTILEPHTFTLANVPRPIPQSYFEAMSQALIQRADEALYRAKKEGGSRIQVSDPLQWQPIVPPVETVA